MSDRQVESGGGGGARARDARPGDGDPRVCICAPARLHMGFLDLNGGLGRSFGSLGLAVSEIRTRLRVRAAPGIDARGPGAQRAARFAEATLEALGVDGGVDVAIDEAIPEHVGLGSGTQMALAVARAVARVHGASVNTETLAGWVARGLRSGVGIGAFQHGGFIVDGGRGEHTRVPPVVSRLPFPARWRVLLIFDGHMQGLNGPKERVAFQKLPPMPEDVAAALCRRTLLQLLPAVAEEDFGRFREALRWIQDRIGDHFAGFQGGRFTSPRVAEAVSWLEARGVHGVGQSSWGPTGFAFVEDPDSAQTLARALSERFADTTALDVVVCGARNTGSVVAEEPHAAAPARRPARA